MIDIDNYKRCVAWLTRCMDEHAADPESRMQRDGLLHAAEVSYNVTESTLRHALDELTGEETFAFVSSRELMRLAAEEGLKVSSREAWLRYGLAIEGANQSLGESLPTTLLPMLPQFAGEFQAFSKRLEQRLVSVV